MVNIPLTIFQYLNTANTNLRNAIGSNLFYNRVHDFDGFTEKGLMFRIRGGVPNEYVPINPVTVDIWCYGGDEHDFGESRIVYQYLNDHLHGQTNKQVDAGYIVKAAEVVSGQDLIDPETKWLFTLTTYTIQVRPN